MLSAHASKRMQQRAIHPLMIDLLYRYGREHHQDGSTTLILDQRARRRARKALLDVAQRFDKLCDAYLVESDSDGKVVTVGHRYKGLRS